MGQKHNKPGVKVYGWNAVEMAENLSREELQQLSESLRDDPNNANPAHAAGKSIYLYTKATHRKLDAVAWAITYQIQRARAQAIATVNIN